MSSFCRSCGISIEEGERFCTNCGRDATAEASTTPVLDPAVAFGLSPDPSGKAIFSLVCGVLSFFPPFALVAIIFGHLSLSEIRKSAGRLKGKGLAIAGLVLGYLATAGTIALVVFTLVTLPRPGKALGGRALTPLVTTNQPSALSALRTLNTAEIAYAQAHPAAGYTCSFNELSGAWPINRELADIRKNGYLITLQGCAPGKAAGPVTKYQVVTHPAPGGRARLLAFCSNQSAVIKVDWNGSPDNCLSSGIDLPEAEVNRPRGWTQTAPH